MTRPPTLRLAPQSAEPDRVVLIGSPGRARESVLHYLSALKIDVVPLAPGVRPRFMARVFATASHILYLAVEPPLWPMFNDLLRREFHVFANTLDAAAAHAGQARFIYASPLSLPPRGLCERILQRLREPWMAYRRACEREVAVGGLPFLTLRVPMLSDAPTAASRYVLADVERARQSARGTLPRGALAVLIGEALRGGYPAGLRVALYADPQGLPLAEAAAQLRHWPDDLVAPQRPTQPLSGPVAAGAFLRRPA